MKKLIFNSVDDFFSNLFYYGRKENHDYPPGVLEDYIRSGIIPVDEIVNKFRTELEKNVQVVDNG